MENSPIHEVNNSEKEIFDLSAEPKKKSKKKLKIIIPIIFFALGIMVLVIILLTQKKIITHDINLINGCPEFYDVEFGMDVYEVSNRVELEHRCYEGIDESSYIEVPEIQKSSFLLLDEDETFYLYGNKTISVHPGFDKKELKSVYFAFSKNDTSFENIVNLYKKIYGEPTEIYQRFTVWKGRKTTILIFDNTTDDDTIEVEYLKTKNSQFLNLSFDESELDPCGFLDSHYIFDKTPNYYIDGLKKDEDYSVNHIGKENYPSDNFQGFTEYTLYPEFEFMGVERGYTAIRFTKADNENTINTVSYSFLTEEKETKDIIGSIIIKLKEKYGENSTCRFELENIAYDDMMNYISNNVDGMYFIEWTNKNFKISLDLTINSKKEYNKGSITYVNKN